MDIYKKASKLRLRVQTSHGNIPVEQLWNLSLNDLDNIAISYNKKVKASSVSESFIPSAKPSAKNEELSLILDILKDIIKDKVESRDKALKAKERRERNNHILSLIQDKKMEEMKGKSVEELTKLLEEDND